MVRRWTALGVVTAQKKFRRIKGYRHMGALVHDSRLLRGPFGIEHRGDHRVGVQPIRSLPPSCSGPGDRHRQLPCSPFPPSDVLIAAVNANVRQAALAARAVQAAVLIVGFAVALEHLAIGRGVVLAAFSIAFGGIVLALALAFGLAGKDIARDLLERNVKGRKDDGQTDEIDHL